MYRNNHITGVVLARRNSTRLRDKMLLPFDGSTVFESAIRRIRASKLIDDFVLAIPNGEENDVFPPIAARLGIEVFRGDEQDVVGRISNAVQMLGRQTDLVVRVNCDNPLMMPSVVDDAIAALVDRGADLITPFENSDVPFGFGCVVFTRDCLSRIERGAKYPIYREHVENYCFDHPGSFRILYQQHLSGRPAADLCFTLDHEIDYKRLVRLSSLVQHLPPYEQAEQILSSISGTSCLVVLNEKENVPVLRRALGKQLRNVRIITNEQVSNDGKYELVVSSASRRSVVAADCTPLGFVIADRENINGTERYCLRYWADQTEPPHRDPIFCDESPEANGVSADAFLIQALPQLMPSLLAGYVRPYSFSEAKKKHLKRLLN